MNELYNWLVAAGIDVSNFDPARITEEIRHEPTFRDRKEWVKKMNYQFKKNRL